MNKELDLNKITTEGRNAKTTHIDKASTTEMLTMINNEDQRIAYEVECAIPSIAKMVDAVVAGFKKSGRLIYVGAGTSGRIGIVDAVECRPTFSCPDEMVQCLMAGGTQAFVRAVEGAEDSEEQAIYDISKLNITANDVIIGISASGRTPYVLAAMKKAKECGCITGGISTSLDSQVGKDADIKIEVVTGPEVITGSTRMKSGTAQKMICNMITTASMIKMGKVYENYMIDVQVTNLKLKKRAINIVSSITGVSDEVAWDNISKYGGVKSALVGIIDSIEDINTVKNLLSQNDGNIQKALEEGKGYKND